jgi:fatty-acyl-CoA synthase
MLDFPPLDEPTLPRVLMQRARLEPKGLASVIVRSDRPDEAVGAADLLDLAARYAEHYRELLGAASRPVVCVCLYHGIELQAAFLGGILAGAIPTMVAPPSPRMERAKYIDSFVRMLQHIRPDCIVTNETVSDALRSLRIEAFPPGRILDADSIRRSGSGPGLEAFVPAQPEPLDVVLLQHSSGTTGLQKGVALSHRAVLEQVRSYAGALALSPRDLVASWLPLYHDMGLVACFLLPLLTGLPVVTLSPFEWVNQPALLLRKIEEYRATLCWLPNFAYSFLARAVRDDQLGEVDLGSVRAFVNCSEPVMARSQADFLARFAPAGVSAEKLLTCYAMAETVFAVTQSPLGRAPRVDRVCRDTFQREHRAQPLEAGGSLEFVSNGPCIDGLEVRITDEQGAELEERHVGEIRVRGRCVFDGYFRRADLTGEAMTDGWYKTGDLGYLAAGELYVTGRKKDLVIIQGRNFYPADIEAVVSEVEGVIPGRVAVFGEAHDETGTEALVVLAETRDGDAAAQGRLKLEIRNRIAQAFDCTAGRILLVPERWLVKSTAGKVARSANRQKYQAQFGR